MTQKNQDTTARISTLVLVLAGVILAVAEGIKDIPALAPYSHWSQVLIGLAVAMKQIILMVQPPKP